MTFPLERDRKIKVGLVFLFLLSAYLNAVLRISAESNLTLFRFLLPIQLLIILCCSPALFAKLFFWVGVLGFYGICQHFFSSRFLYTTVPFDFIFFVEYWFHYSSILIVFVLVLCLKNLEGERFTQNFASFTTFFIKFISILIFIYTVILKKPLMTIKVADNINNVSCMFAAGLPVLIFKSKTEKKNPIFWEIFFLFLTLYNDSKAVFLGICLEIAICIFLSISSIIRKGKARIRRILILFFIAIVILVVLLSPSINGYSLSEITAEPVRRIIQNDPYPKATSSTSYRTNSTITTFQIIKKSFGFGVGFGNTGRILKAVMSNVYPKWATSVSYSLHNYWLELMCDFGWPAIITGIYLFLKEIKSFFRKDVYSTAESLRTIFLLSFPVWSISASGLLTEYFTLAVFLFALIIDENYTILGNRRVK